MGDQHKKDELEQWSEYGLFGEEGIGSNKCSIKCQVEGLTMLKKLISQKMHVLEELFNEENMKWWYSTSY